MVEVAVPTRVHITPFLSVSPNLPICRKIVVTKVARKISGVVASSSSTLSTSSGFGYKQKVDDGQVLLPKKTSKERVFFLDVNPLCYEGSKPSLQSFAHWVSLFFNQVSLSDPVIAVSPSSFPPHHVFTEMFH